MILADSRFVPEQHRHLAIVDTDSGETLPECPDCRQRDDTIAGLEHTIRSLSAKNTALKRDRAKAAAKHELFPRIAKAFDHWKRACGHPQSPWTTKRFEQAVECFTAFSDELCWRAIDGAAFDPYETKRKNGTMKRHDDWSLIFRDPDKLIEFSRRIPQHPLCPFLDLTLPADERPRWEYLAGDVYDWPR